MTEEEMKAIGLDFLDGHYCIVGDGKKNEKMCDALRTCEPYLIYTGLDGTEQRFDLLTEQ